MNKFSQIFAILSLLSLVLLGLSSCNKYSPESDLDFGENYFPLELNKYWVYDVDSIIYDNVGNITVIDTVSFKLKETITDTLFDNQNRQVYLVERSELRNASVGWEVKDIWVAQLTNNQAQRVEENLRFIKLIFPVSLETTPWNGNSFIDPNTIVTVAGESVVIFKNWLYEYSEVDEYRELGSLAFDSTLTVVQASEENLIELRYSAETYAKGVGLIYKEMKILDTQCISNCAGEDWEEKAEKGFIVKQTIIDHN